ncbi:MAG: O-antigen/teichoic acid export membrane protein, partial [Oleiphilaceae bacterium]
PAWLMSFFGEEFRVASTALVILALGQFVNIATGSVGYLLSMTGLERKVRDNAFFSAIIGVTLGFVLIPIYGLLGASVATAIAIASQNLLGVYQVRKHLGFNTLKFWQ